MLHRTLLTPVRRALDAALRAHVDCARVRPPVPTDRAALFFRCTAVGLYAAVCAVSGWVVVRALLG